MAGEGLYQPLNLTNQIRLLRLLPLEPGQGNDSSQYELFTSDLDSCENTYSALSYAWGSPDQSVRRIKVNGIDFPVRENLGHALAALRTAGERVFWIDAICIDQDNKQERNHQVKQMGDIYRRAAQVFVWLGQPESGPNWGADLANALDIVWWLGCSSLTSSMPPAPPDIDPSDSHDVTDHIRWMSKMMRFCGSRDQLRAEQKRNELGHDDSKGDTLLGKINSWRYLRWRGQPRAEQERNELVHDDAEGDALRSKIKSWLHLKDLVQVTYPLSQELFLQAEGRLHQLRRQIQPLELTLRETGSLEPEQESRMRALLRGIAREQEDMHAIRYDFDRARQDGRKLKILTNDLWLDLRSMWDSLQIKEPSVWIGDVFGNRHASSREAAGSLLDNIIRLRCLELVCELPYWNRLWIVQEVLLAKEIRICFGDDGNTTVSWDMLAGACSCLDQIPKSWVFDCGIGESITRIKESVPFRLARQRADGTQGWPLHELLKVTQASLCENPRDKIFGLLGIANDANINDLEIDYSKSMHNTCQDTILWYQRSYGDQLLSASAIGFAQLLMQSFLNHGEQLDRQDFLLPASSGGGAAGGGPARVTEAMAVEVGDILPLEQLIQNGDLLRARSQDWISVMAEYDGYGIKREPHTKQKQSQEHLDSVCMNLFITSQRSYAVVQEEEDVCQREGLASKAVSISAPAEQNAERHCFFMAGKGRFGVASTVIREDDVLCLLEKTDIGVILRKQGDRYRIVSRAVVAPEAERDETETETRDETEAETEAEIHGGPGRRSHDSRSTSSMARGEPAPSRTFKLLLDCSTIYDLIEPITANARGYRQEPPGKAAHEFNWWNEDILGDEAEVYIAIDVPQAISVAVPDNIQDSGMEAPGRSVDYKDKARTAVGHSEVPSVSQSSPGNWVESAKPYLAGNLLGTAVCFLSLLHQGQ